MPFARIPRAVLLLVMGAGATSAQAAICRASTTGASAADGSSWAAAMTLPGALAAAHCSEIWLKQGLYVAPDYAGFAINRPLHLYGGFQGVEDLRVQRGNSSRKTVLTGDRDGNDAVDGDGIVLDAADIVEGAFPSNAIHVLTIGGATHGGNSVYTRANTVIDGLTITAGYARVSTGLEMDGGGLLCNATGLGSECSPTVSNVTFSGNQANGNGGAIAILAYGGSSQPLITHSLFTGNRAGNSPTNGQGGAIAAVARMDSFSPGNPQGSVALSIEHSTLHGNRAGQGAAVYVYSDNVLGNARIAYSTLTDNFAGSEGGALYARATLTDISHSIFWGNGSALGSALRYADGPGLTAATGPLAGNIIELGAASVVLDTGAGAVGMETGDPLLNALADNRGPTWSRTTLSNLSAARYKFTCPAGLTDQRGAARPTGGDACDIGAVQSLPALPGGFPRVSSTGGEPGQISIGWDRAPGAVDYEVFDVTDPLSPVLVCRTSGDSCVLAGLGLDEQRDLRLVGINEQGTGAPVFINGRSAGPVGPGVPSQPTSVPTLGAWGMALLAGLMGLFGRRAVGARRTASSAQLRAGLKEKARMRLR